jgi:hypothetical protein
VIDLDRRLTVTREEASFQHRQRPCPHQRSDLAVLCGLTQILLASKAMASAAWTSGLYLSSSLSTAASIASRVRRVASAIRTPDVAFGGL